ncbi:FBP domain-containing protein [Actinomadura sp. GC306]|uniref:FBP domain-containing protein n=1 Tax=Actinomadura sp. GC306 TaxID=2530367 RepID=UPI001044B504|nr:FBP domain-containing protein [Actinomadura sp. GC306]TDC59170.1 FBP domain-containing protein [Actinomadura sp. GC306]
MEPVTERDLRASFVNCSRGEARRLTLPRDFADTPWDDLDFLGWRDPRAPERAYLAAYPAAGRGGRLVGLALRAAPGGARGFTARSMCSLCLTTRTGGAVSLMTARRTGEAGRHGDSVGRYLCGDLDCSLYVRGRKRSVAGGELEESLPVAEKVARVRANLDAFLDAVTR